MKYETTDIEVYTSGLIHCSVCVPQEMPREEVERLVNIVNPSGVTPWRISDEAFRGGEDNPHECEEKDDRVHYLLNC